MSNLIYFKRPDGGYTQVDPITNPSYIKELYSNGSIEVTQAEYEAHTATSEPVEPVLSKQEQYKELVIAKIRSKYSLEDEIALNRQRYTKPDEFAVYNQFCEQCKADAKIEIYG